MILLTSRDAFDEIKFAGNNAKKIPVSGVVMISPLLIKVSMLFFPIKTTDLCTSYLNYGAVESKACCVILVGLKVVSFP